MKILTILLFYHFKGLNLGYTIGAILSILILVYLIYALIKPEKF